MSKTIAVVHDPASHSPIDLKNAIDELAEIVWVVVDGNDGGRVPRLILERLGTVVEVSSADLRLAADSLADAQIEGIVAFRDDQLPLTARIAERLALPFHSPAAAATSCNKLRQREALAEAGVPQPRFWHLPAGLDADALRQAALGVAFPAVIKPVNGAGSKGVGKLSSPADLETAYRQAVDHIVEDYMSDSRDRDPRLGSYVSVESIVSSAGISHAAITGRLPLASGFREAGAFIQAAESEELTASLLDLAASAIRAIGLSSGCVHTEIKLTPDGPRVIEVNGRLGGPIAAILSQVSTVSLFRTAAEIALGLPVRFDELVACDGVGFILEWNPPLDATLVLDVRGTAELAALPWSNVVKVQASAQDVIDPGRGTFGVVSVLGRAERYEQLFKVIDVFNQTVEIDYQFSDAN